MARLGGGGALTLFFLALALGAVAAGLVIVPLLLRRRALMADLTPSSQVDAEARRRVALASLREVEYDRVAGKLDDEDYRRLRTQLEREALVAITAAEKAAGGGGDAPIPANGAATDTATAAGAVLHACGFSNPAGSRFCAGCGQKLG